MNSLQQELVTAKTVIANQQIYIQRLTEQINVSYILDPDGALIHTACGKSGIGYDIENKEFERSCDCFE